MIQPEAIFKTGATTCSEQHQQMLPMIPNSCASKVRVGQGSWSASRTTCWYQLCWHPLRVKGTSTGHQRPQNAPQAPLRVHVYATCTMSSCPSNCISPDQPNC